MSAKPRGIKAAAEPRLRYRPSAPELWRLLFVREESVSPRDHPGENYSVGFTLTLGRVHSRHIGIELTATVSDVPWVERETLVVSYRMYFLIYGRASEQRIEEDVRLLASQTGPSTLFPFIRETVASVTMKTGRQIMLPLVHWDTMFTEIEIPPPEPEAPPQLLESIDSVESRSRGSTPGHPPSAS